MQVPRPFAISIQGVTLTTDTDKARECLRQTSAGYGCAIARERNRAMGNIVNAEVGRVIGEPRPSCNGKSIIDLIWEQLLEKYEDLLVSMKNHEVWRNRGIDPSEENVEDLGAYKGHCLGLATALAILHNPYSPDVDAIRKECVERYENR
jgi:hypothetical protein